MTENMIKIAGVRFRENWKVYDFDATDIEVAVGDKVVVDSERGQGFAVVVRLKRQEGPPAPAEEPVRTEQGLQIEEDASPGAAQGTPSDADKPAPKTLRRVLRKATEDDLLREQKNVEREAEAFAVAQDMITEREHPMKLIRVEYSFDASRATFFFFSETRVDFRELVKDLAYKLRSRIEMRQIGVRDVARMIGGFGPCGRELCCSAFLKNFEPVSIRMAKKQEMVLNPAKISGVCGRLLCCLSYEYEMYDEIKKDAAGMRDAAAKEKKEEERRVTEERQEAEAKRNAEERRHQEDRKPQEPRREKQKEEQRGGAKPEKKKEAQQERRGQRPAEQARPRQPQQAQVKQEKQEPQEQKAQEPQQPGEKTGKRKKRRFWRRKKKGSQQGENKPQGPGTT
jgi:cell fate regulator YaaT (PSP1 superfamily)